MSIITIERKILEKNDAVANQNRGSFKEKKIFALNLVSSPGAGKTSLIEKTLEVIKDVRIAVIEGDVQTDLDAKRVAKFGVPVVQIVTNGACHLEAALVRDAFKQLNDQEINLLFIENVGNLICPAGYDLGENMKVVILSVTEGDDKPLKYPAMFRNASVLIINKIDLIPYVNCSPEELEKNALTINPKLKIFRTSCTTLDGIRELSRWLKSNIL
jgi:hydrogenase nickel incorporation protein HypB